MRVTRIFTPEALQAPGRAALEGTAATHVARVLRLRSGDGIRLFNGDGWEYEGRVVALRGSIVDVELLQREPGAPDSPLALTLMQGVARGERMDLVIQKATELGVVRIVPILAERSVVRLDRRQALRKLEHWRAVAVAACEQSGRVRLPVVEAPVSLREALPAAPASGCRFTLSRGAAVALAALAAGTPSATLLIGPEGGLTEGEVSLAAGAGFEPRALGPRILRTETAALAALAVLQAAAGDLR